MIEKKVSFKNIKERTSGEGRERNMEGGIQYGEIHWHQPERQAVLAEMMRGTHAPQQPCW